ncbi:MAG TPA: glycosyltransferase family 4 protein [Sedimentisphaerales bacterium]|jgi:glycosyltransferase involved in cell wall biosynthesis|nr:glycosyltransferase family 4 protein [Sedimentisphaerales bacterium]HNU29644.1 glycosyltransferase family 4 protein [Sedimentisphaerales bacterium]
MRYAVPRIFHNAGLLERFYTDIVAAHGWRQIAGAIPEALQPASLRRLFSRGMEIADLPRERVKTFPLLGLTYAFRLMKGPNADTRTRIHLDVQDTFSRKILKCGLGEATHLYCFDTASLGIMRAVAGNGMRIVMEQTIAPRPVLSQLLQREREKYPGWEDSDTVGSMDGEIQARYREAWALADTIVGGSEFVRDGIARSGGPASKCVVVPYGVDFGSADMGGAVWRRGVVERRYARRRAGEPLHVLTVGSVGLRKGAPYVLEAARALGNRAQSRMVGGIEVSRQAAHRLGEHVQLVGLVPRNEVRAHYLWADVFLFPSVCEGSATVVYEALAYGLPVICTPNTGSVVKDGVDGFIVEPSSGEAVIAALEKVIVSPERWLTMSQNAFTTSDQMDVKHYGERLLRALGCGDVR